jgi:DNA replication protein DnaC
VFSEIVDAIEKRGVLLIATSNLTIDEIKVKYGIRTYDRLRAHMNLVVIKEKSLRG